MGLLFDDATPDYLQADTAAFTAAPATVSLWFRHNTSDSTDAMWWVGDKDVDDEFWAGESRIGTPNHVTFQVKDSGASEEAQSTPGPSINTWHHYCAVEVGASEHSVFLDGADKATLATSISPTGADRTTLGRFADSTPGENWAGDLAHVAVYDDNLVEQNVQTLANGWSPRQVAIDNLAHYWPVNGVQSPEPDIVGGLNLTLFGTPVLSEEPPIPKFLVAA